MPSGYHISFIRRCARPLSKKGSRGQSSDGGHADAPGRLPLHGSPDDIRTLGVRAGAMAARDTGHPSPQPRGAPRPLEPLRRSAKGRAGGARGAPSAAGVRQRSRGRRAEGMRAPRASRLPRPPARPRLPRPPVPSAEAVAGLRRRKRDGHPDLALGAVNVSAPGPVRLTCVPTTTICGSWMMSAPTVLNTSCSLLMTGISASIAAGEGQGGRGVGGRRTRRAPAAPSAAPCACRHRRRPPRTARRPAASARPPRTPAPPPGTMGVVGRGGPPRAAPCSESAGGASVGGT